MIGPIACFMYIISQFEHVECDLNIPVIMVIKPTMKLNIIVLQMLLQTVMVPIVPTSTTTGHPHQRPWVHGEHGHHTVVNLST